MVLISLLYLLKKLLIRINSVFIDHQEQFSHNSFPRKFELREEDYNLVRGKSES